MADGYVQVEADSTGKKVDTEELAGGTHRERMILAGTTLAAVAPVTNADPSTTAYGLPTRPIAYPPPVTASGTLDALDEAVTLEIQNRPYVGITLSGGTTADMQVIAESLTDAGTWDERYMLTGDNLQAVDDLPHAVEDIRTYTVITNPADTQVRLRVYAYTSGSIDVTVKASHQFPAGFLLAAVAGAFQMIPASLGALNAEIVVPCGIRPNVCFALAAGTLAATVVVEGSLDSHSTSWPFTLSFHDGVNMLQSKAFTNPNSATFLRPILSGALQRVRLRVSSYTSGAAVAYARASHVADPLGILVASGTLEGQPKTLIAQTMAGNDGTSHRHLQLRAATPAVADYGVVTREARAAAVGTRTQVADNAADVLILAANASRIGATVFNDSTVALYLGLGTTTASTTNYTVQIAANGYYETPPYFTGQIRGIWASDPGTGAARVTELTQS